MSMLIFLRGYPGVGKSYLAKLLTEYISFVYINPDEIKNDELYVFDRSYRVNIYNYNLKIAKEEILRGSTVLWDQPWRKYENINLTSNQVKAENTYIIELVDSIENCWKRCKNKYQGYSFFKQYCSKYTKNEGSLPTLTIEASCSNDEKITKILQFCRV